MTVIVNGQPAEVTDGQTVAELLATGRVPELIAPFGPGRFAGRVPAGTGGGTP